MAKARIDTIEVSPACPAVCRDEVVLILSTDEAETLLRICYKIGGSPVTSRRKHIDAIHKALFEAGVNVPYGVQFIGPAPATIVFADESNVCP